MAGARPPIDFSPSFRVLSWLAYRLTLAAVIAFDRIVFRLRVRGRAHLRVPRAFLVSNHSLYLDPGIIADAIRPRRAYFSALEATFRAPVLGAYIRLLGAFPIPAERPLERLRSPLARALASRGLVHFFPEGRLRRLRPGVAGFQDGVFLLAVTMGVPVIPVVVLVRPRCAAGVLARFLPPRIGVVVTEAVDPARFRSGRPRERARAMKGHVRAVMRAVLAEGPATTWPQPSP